MAQHKELVKLARATGAPVTSIVVEVAPQELHIVPTLLRRVAQVMEDSGCASLARQMLSEADGRLAPEAALKLIGRYVRLQGLAAEQLCGSLSAVAQRRAQQMATPVVEAPLYQRVTKGSFSACRRASAGVALSLEEKMAGLFYLRSNLRHTLEAYIKATAPHPLPVVEAALAWFAPPAAMAGSLVHLRPEEPLPPRLLEWALRVAPEAVLAAPGVPRSALLVALQQQPQSLWAVPAERLDEELVETALRAEASANPRSLELLYEKCALKTPHLDMVAVQVDPANLSHVSAQTRDLVLSAVSRRGCLLEVSEFVDEEIVDAACAQDGFALEHYHGVLTGRQRLLALKSAAVILLKRRDLFPNLTAEEKALAIEARPNLFLPEFGVDSADALHAYLQGLCLGHVDTITVREGVERRLADWVTAEMLAVVAHEMLDGARKNSAQRAVDYFMVLGVFAPILTHQTAEFQAAAAAACGELLWVMPKSAPVEVFMAGVLADPAVIEAVPARWK